MGESDGYAAIQDNYYLSFPKDPITRKVIVYSVWILEALQLALVTRDTYELFINGFGNLLGINDLRLLPLSVPILGGTSECTLLVTIVFQLNALSWANMPPDVCIPHNADITVQADWSLNHCCKCSELAVLSA